MKTKIEFAKPEPLPLSSLCDGEFFILTDQSVYILYQRLFPGVAHGRFVCRTFTEGGPKRQVMDGSVHVRVAEVQTIEVLVR